ncbi:MAG: fibronectin type III domain-containing protein [Flavobacteriales bacterium]|nr:fibronectin type III domain-containing protein [Flavobacteriales bacterium]
MEQSTEGIVNLRGLVPGNYRFELKVMNREGRGAPSPPCG